MSAALPLSLSDAARDDVQSVDRTTIIASKVSGVADSEHYVQTPELHQRQTTPQTAYTVSELSFKTWVDEPVVAPVSGTPQLGKPVKINFGLSGHAYLRAVELVVKLKKRIYTVATGADAQTDKWKDVEFVPYAGLAFLGEKYTVKMQGEIVNETSVDGLHFRRELEFDQSSEALNAYKDAVGASEVVRDTATYYVPLDIHYSDKKPLVMLAHGAEHELSFTPPSADKLVRWANNITTLTAGNAVEVTVEDCFLRCHVEDIDQAGRYGIASYLLEKGIKYHISQIESVSTHEEEAAAVVAADSGSATYEFQSSTLSFSQPSAYIYFVLRARADLAGKSDAVHADEEAVIDALAAGSGLRRPDRFRALPIISWVVKANNQNFVPRMTWDYYNRSLHAKMFNSENFKPIGIVSYTDKPLLADDHSVGHITHTSLNKPTLHVKFRKAPYDSATESGTTLEEGCPVKGQDPTFAPVFADYTSKAPQYIFSTWSVAYNFLFGKQGRVFKNYT